VESLHARAVQVAQRRFLRERTMEALRAWDYDVEEVLDVTGDLDSLRVRHSKLGVDQVAVTVGARSLEHQLLRGARPRGDDEAGALDREHCRTWSDDARRLVEVLRLSGAPVDRVDEHGVETIGNTADHASYEVPVQPGKKPRERERS